MSQEVGNSSTVTDVEVPSARNDAGRRVAVVGAGTMGAGIAESMLHVGAHVVVIEADPTRAEAARGRVLDGLQRHVTRAGDTERDEVAPAYDDALIVRHRLEHLDVHLIVEAVPENQRLKRDLLAMIEGHVSPRTIIATNTSSISIDSLCVALRRPDRFVGMHFFNPVPRSELIEVVIGTRTADETVRRVDEWVDLLGKTAIHVHDSPGFATSRLGLAIGLEAIRMLEEGVASAEDIDRAMVLGYRFPMGPLRLTDLIGLDVRLGIAEQLADDLGDRFDPPALLREMVRVGRLGKKVGRGFFEW